MCDYMYLRFGAVLGGVMLHLACGSMYCWGNLVSYLPAHLKYWSPAGGSGPPRLKRSGGYFGV